MTKLDQESLPSVEELLERKGVVRDSVSGDYQGYIERQEKVLPQGLPHADLAPLRGNVHIALGKVAPRQNIDQRFKAAFGD